MNNFPFLNEFIETLNDCFPDSTKMMPMRKGAFNATIMANLKIAGSRSTAGRQVELPSREEPHASTPKQSTDWSKLHLDRLYFSVNSYEEWPDSPYFKRHQEVQNAVSGNLKVLEAYSLFATSLFGDSWSQLLDITRQSEEHASAHCFIYVPDEVMNEVEYAERHHIPLSAELAKTAQSILALKALYDTHQRMRRMMGQLLVGGRISIYLSSEFGISSESLPTYMVEKNVQNIVDWGTVKHEGEAVPRDAFIKRKQIEQLLFDTPSQGISSTIQDTPVSTEALRNNPNISRRNLERIIEKLAKILKQERFHRADKTYFMEVCQSAIIKAGYLQSGRGIEKTLSDMLKVNDDLTKLMKPGRPRKSDRMFNSSVDEDETTRAIIDKLSCWLKKNAPDSSATTN